MSATKNCVEFLREVTFLVIKPMKTQLNLKFYLREARRDHPIRKSTLWNSKFETHIRLSSPDELDGNTFKFIRESWSIS